MTQEQNTATSAETINLTISGTEEDVDRALQKNYVIINDITWCKVDHMKVVMQQFIDQLIAEGKLFDVSKLKELSEKGEPTEEEIKAWAEKNFSSPLAIVSACGAADWMRDRLSPVIALLHHDIAWAKAEKKQKDEEIAALKWQLEAQKGITASAVASAEKEIAALRAENQNLILEKIADNALYQSHKVEISDLNRTIASLRAQLETEHKNEIAFARWILSEEGLEYLNRGHSVDSAYKHYASKGGKAHE